MIAENSRWGIVVRFRALDESRRGMELSGPAGVPRIDDQFTSVMNQA